MSKISSIPFKSNIENNVPHLNNENNSKTFHMYHHIETIAISYLESIKEKDKKKSVVECSPKKKEEFIRGVNSIYLNKTSVVHKCNSMNNINYIHNDNFNDNINDNDYKSNKKSISFHEFPNNHKEDNENKENKSISFISNRKDMTNNTHSKQTKSESQCRICYDSSTDDNNKLIQACKCEGSIKHIHEDCLKKWIDENKKNLTCELCNSPFYVHFFFEKKFLPKKYKKLVISMVKSMILSVIFCISLYILMYFIINNSFDLSNPRNSVMFYVIMSLFCVIFLSSLLFCYVNNYKKKWWKTELVSWRIYDVTYIDNHQESIVNDNSMHKLYSSSFSKKLSESSSQNEEEAKEEGKEENQNRNMINFLRSNYNFHMIRNRLKENYIIFDFK